MAGLFYMFIDNCIGSIKDSVGACKNEICTIVVITLSWFIRKLRVVIFRISNNNFLFLLLVSFTRLCFVQIKRDDWQS